MNGKSAPWTGSTTRSGPAKLSLRRLLNCLLGLRLDDELDAPVRGAALDRRVVGDRVGRALALAGDQIRRDALGDKVVTNGRRALLREVHVHVDRADVVGVPV